MKRLVIGTFCIGIITIMTTLGIKTAVEYGQVKILLLLWAVAIPLMLITWALFCKVFHRSEHVFTPKGVMAVLLGSLAISSEVVYTVI